MKILLTGASGFLGSALALRLKRDGHDLALLLRPNSSLRRLEGETFEIGRYANEAELRMFVRGVAPQAVIHTACSYGRQGETLLDLTDANLRLGLALLQALPTTVDAPCLFLNTGTALPAETSPYALSKVQLAGWGHQQAKAAPHRLKFVNVELQHMFGPGDDESKFTTRVVHACHRNEPELALTAGEQTRDFIYIDDVVDAYATLLERSDCLGAAADVPLGSGSAPSVREFVQTVHRLCRSRTRLDFGAVPYRPTEAMHCQADLTLMNGMGWSPHWGLEAGIERMIELEF